MDNNIEELDLRKYTIKLKENASKIIYKTIDNSSQYQSLQDLITDIMEPISRHEDAATNDNTKRLGVSKNTIRNFMTINDSKESFLAPVLISKKLGISLDEMFFSEPEDTEMYLIRLARVIENYGFEFVRLNNQQIALVSKYPFITSALLEMSIRGDGDYIATAKDIAAKSPQREQISIFNKTNTDFMGFLYERLPSKYLIQRINQFATAPSSIDGRELSLEDDEAKDRKEWFFNEVYEALTGTTKDNYTSADIESEFLKLGEKEQAEFLKIFENDMVFKLYDDYVNGLV